MSTVSSARRGQVLLVASPGVAELAEFLERVGHEITHFETGTQLLGAVEGTPKPACIVCDVELADMTVLELLESLQGRRRVIPVMVITRHHEVAAAVEVMRYPGSDYLTRPYVERDLVSRLRRALVADIHRMGIATA